MKDVSDFLICGAFLILGQIAFAFIVIGVPIRWLSCKMKKQPRNLYWMYQARNDWAGGVLAWVGFWFGIFAATYAMAIS